MVQEGSFNLYININLGGGLQFLCFMFGGGQIKCLEYCAAGKGLMGRETEFPKSGKTQCNE